MFSQFYASMSALVEIICRTFYDWFVLKNFIYSLFKYNNSMVARSRSNTQYFGVNVYIIQFENLIGNLISEIEGIS